MASQSFLGTGGDFEHIEDACRKEFSYICVRRDGARVQRDPRIATSSQEAPNSKPSKGSLLCRASQRLVHGLQEFWEEPEGGPGGPR